MQKRSTESLVIQAFLSTRQSVRRTPAYIRNDPPWAAIAISNHSTSSPYIIEDGRESPLSVLARILESLFPGESVVSS